jgi:hypothetical protein
MKTEELAGLDVRPVIEGVRLLMALGTLYLLERMSCPTDMHQDIYTAIATVGEDPSAPIGFQWSGGRVGVVVRDLPSLVERTPEIARTLGGLEQRGITVTIETD